jgi:hypothetical protein
VLAHPLEALSSPSGLSIEDFGDPMKDHIVVEVPTVASRGAGFQVTREDGRRSIRVVGLECSVVGSKEKIFEHLDMQLGEECGEGVPRSSACGRPRKRRIGVFEGLFLVGVFLDIVGTSVVRQSSMVGRETANSVGVSSLKSGVWESG